MAYQNWKTVDIAIHARDEASATFTRIQGQMGRFGDTAARH